MKAHRLLVVAALSLAGATQAQTQTPPDAGAAAAPASVQAKRQVRTQADLPRFTYPIDRAPSDLLLADDATFARFAAPVRTDIERLLASYDVQDRGTLRTILTVKRNLQLLSGVEDAAALVTTRQIRALEDKPDTQLWSGLLIEAVLKARVATGTSSGDTFAAAFRREYAALVDPLPWPVVANSARRDLGMYEIATPQVGQGLVKANIDPAAIGQSLGGEAAWNLVRYREIVKAEISVGPTVAAVLNAYVGRNNVPQADIWAARDVTLTAADTLTPVRVAIWDTGVDPDVYGGLLYTDPHPGHHDPHGLAFDLLNRPTHGDLLPLTPEQQRAYPGMVDYIKGQWDLQANVNSPEAQAFKRKVAAMPPAEASAFWEQLSLFMNYVHGSHVAGIAARGNPAIRLVVARLTPEWKQVPTAPPSEELFRRGAAVYADYVRYFRDHGVRVVNMSWGNKTTYVEQDLEKSGIGKDAAERKTIAARLFAIDKAGLEAAIRSAPDILFICSAGNDNDDVGFSDDIPSSLHLSNLLTVGAVDQAGDATSFTSYGDAVRVYGNGYNVPSRVPGGREIPISGTSMASPQVSNLAAKLFALAPKLTPQQAIDLIVRGATMSQDGKRRLIDPKASVALLKGTVR